MFGIKQNGQEHTNARLTSSPGLETLFYSKNMTEVNLVKATGVVRRIDDLGRIVIPIEIRRTMNIRDGDPLEIFVDKDGEVILKKYSAIAELGDFAQEIADSLQEATGHVALITDRDQVVAVAGAPEREFINKAIGPVVIKSMETRSVLHFAEGTHRHEGCLIGEGEDCTFCGEVMAPIVVAGDPIGTVIICTRDPGARIGELEQKLAETAAGFLARHLEE